MELTLERIEQKVGADPPATRSTWRSRPRAVTVLLGATRASKTSADARIGRPGRAGRRPRHHSRRRRRRPACRFASLCRDECQQFINYPSMSVADNIARQLKLRGEGNIAQRAGSSPPAAHRAHTTQACP